VINAFTWVFLLALGLATATRLWLALRQIRHVRAHRDAVPRTFAEAIPLGAHQKAADYTVAKARLGMIDVLLGAAVLLALTLGASSTGSRRNGAGRSRRRACGTAPRSSRPWWC